VQSKVACSKRSNQQKSFLLLSRHIIDINVFFSKTTTACLANNTFCSLSLLVYHSSTHRYYGSSSSLVAYTATSGAEQWRTTIPSFG
jgi:hypothetical protein